MELKILQPLPNFLRINNLTPTEQFAFWSSLSTRELIENNNNSSNKNINNNNNINNASDIAARSKRLGKPGRKPVRDLNKPFQCETCEYSSKSKSNFTIHMRIHTGEKPFTCPECDYATSQKGNLRIHQERRHGLGRAPRRSAPQDFAVTLSTPQFNRMAPTSRSDELPNSTLNDSQSVQASMANTLAYLGSTLGAFNTSLTGPETPSRQSEAADDLRAVPGPRQSNSPDTMSETASPPSL